MKPESPRFRRKRSKAKSAARTRRYPGYKEFQRLCNEVKQGEHYEIKSNDTLKGNPPLYLNLQNQEPKEEEGSIFDDNCPNDTQKELRQNQEVKGKIYSTARTLLKKQVRSFSKSWRGEIQEFKPENFGLNGEFRLTKYAKLKG